MNFVLWLTALAGIFFMGFETNSKVRFQFWHAVCKSNSNSANQN